MPLDALKIGPEDNVATAVRKLEEGENIAVGFTGWFVKLAEAIPLGHKFALLNIRTGEPVIKYGEIIGLATRDIAAGEHVHVHNVEGRKGRGDKV